MPSQSLTTEIFVLTKRPPSDAFEMVTAFSAEHGNLAILQRLTRKPASALTLLDLFDEASVLLESSNQGQTWFLKEARLLTRPVEIGRSYDTLRFAAALTSLVARNPVHEDSRRSVATLVRTALAAFATSSRPDVVYFKSLYRFARDEGYPLKEQWFPTLPASDRAVVTMLVNRPLAEQTTSAEPVARLLRRMEEYLKGHTEILVD
ncbi:MAG TPA: hypothetical protein VHE61_06585 [Opitutaceae bacterium]|nr:hypothetical protein [Opitutaceae bacterium]